MTRAESRTVPLVCHPYSGGEAMRKSSKRGRGLASALGLSLLAMLALGAFGAGAAQAAPQWHIQGSVFTGNEEVAWATAGTAVLRNANGMEVSCRELTGTSMITGGNGDYGTLTLNKCSFVGLHECTVEPVTNFPLREVWCPAGTTATRRSSPAPS